ncbi:TetR/AcrR family transcriptional regulator [Kocuria oceani]|uniref:TetR/AcrR family transcriptional regulator n=1 Tax=Kocuria oceani TaxID=988827 RepID=A0ABV9TPQ7_9MICC|nr:TetR/AcrR family transcriptional regulator [Kocuria oceani]
MARPRLATHTATPRGRPRDAGRGEELLHAAQDLLVEVGYEHLSMDAVATRARASKSTLYRRWSSKAELVAAALVAFEWNDELPNTGVLRTDLASLARVWFDPDQRRDQLFVRLLTAIADDDQLHKVYVSQIAQPRAHALTKIVDRAVARGEIPPHVDATRVGGILPAMAFQQLVVLRRPIDAAFLHHVLDDIVLPLLQVSPCSASSSGSAQQ